MEYQTFGYLSFYFTGNECQSHADMMENNSGFRYCIQQPKLELEKGDDYDEKKKKIDRYKKVSSALLKKGSAGI
jgi:hypothetical protein